ncbi:DUF5317 domain-containing protein [Clostridium estertheticum]|uniref:DUF5317 domain-containing protein n=1 Tax=Clostridium estertheticum TaxID=238834 RepID=A0AA47I5H9_9CLOT|nr:DUF5317 family protein [Clostridium estertheticum]MBU3154906.1 DUF5317 domain-containing protein [Clostridium estertheticum]MBU3200399.1 DUF5317 domain-containing protein [Clostridium estertheticum]WAG58730.1 DUF5317 domain-containing protein [Clostridium estertheticum]WAG67230.1 DUF5317 domain-containing protein [Clostridium estertheticum]
MIEPILLALVFAKIKGYKIRPLFKNWAIYPVLTFVLLYVISEVMIFNDNYSFIKYTSVFHYFYLLTFIILIIKYKLNFSAIIGSIFIIIGSILNKIVIAANNGKMPVFPKLSYLTGYVKPDSFMKVKDIHILGSGVTKMKFLTDIIDVGYCIMSIGDICIRVFVFIILFNTIKVINKT